jgi:hypothetical protein
MGIMQGRTRSAMKVLGLCLCSGLALGLGAGMAAGNPPPQGPSTAPDPTQPGKPHSDDTRSSPMVTVPRIIVSPTTTPGLEPVRPNVPPGAGQDLALGVSPPLLREGAFVSGAKAQLVKGQSGRWYAIYDADATGVRLPPMIVLDNAYLGAMERVAGNGVGGDGAPRMRVSGRVLVYRDRNFLLPSAPPIVERVVTVDPDAAMNAASAAASAAASKAAEHANQPAAAKSGAGGGEPSIEQIVADLDKAVGTTSAKRPSTEPATPVTVPTAVESAAAATAATAEAGVSTGFLTARRGRVVRGSDGALMAVVDSGSSGKSEGPMLLLPCQNMAAIETIMDTAAEGTSFTLTGEVFSYRGKRYLLPTMYSVNRASDNINSAH